MFYFRLCVCGICCWNCIWCDIWNCIIISCCIYGYQENERYVHRPWTGPRFLLPQAKPYPLGDDDDDDGYDGEDDGANDVMIGDQNDDYYRHNSSNRHEASLVV